MTPERRPEDEKSPRTPSPGPGMKKKELDKVLSSDEQDDATRTGIGRTMKLAAVDLPDQLVQTLRLPTVGPEGAKEPVPPPPPPPSASASRRPSEPVKKPRDPAASRSSQKPKERPLAEALVSPSSPTADLPPSQNPFRNRRDAPKVEELPLPETADLPADRNPLLKSRRDTPPRVPEIPDTADIPPDKNPSKKAARGPDRRSTWRLPSQEAAALLPPPPAWPATGAGTTRDIADPAHAPTQPKPELETVEVRSPAQSDSARARGEVRRLREPSWNRFGQVSGSDKGAPHDDLRPGSRLGSMRIESLLVRGSGFTRYVGTDPDGQQVLVEVASVSSSVDTAAFVRTAQAVARLDDSRLVRLLDAGEERGLLFTVYEGWRWRTASQQIARQRPKADRSARIVRDAALGLGIAHAAGIQHGSLSGADLLVDDSGRTRIAGLGRPRVRDEDERTEPAPIDASPHFAAPELPRKPPTALSDQWSLGAILHALVALEPPRAHAPYLRDATLACPPPLEAIAARAMAAKPDARYSSLAALAADLDRFLSGAKVEAPPVSPHARLARRLAPRKALALATLGAGLAAAVLVPLLTGPSSRVEKARELAREAEALAGKDSRHAERAWREASELAPRDPEVVRLGPRIADAVALEEARALAETRQSAAEALAKRAEKALERAAQLHRSAEDALVERRNLDPQPGAARSPGAAWAKVELRRRAASADAARAEGEAWACLVLAASLDPHGAGAARLPGLDRNRLAAARLSGDPASVAFETAASAPSETPRGKVAIRSVPAGAEVLLERYVARGQRLVARPFDPARPDDEPISSPLLAERTPVTRLELPPGSYLARVRLAGFKTACVPIYIPPEARDWDATVELVGDLPENEGWVLVPRGPAWFPERNAWLEVGPFLMKETELAGDGGRPRRSVTLAQARADAAREGARLALPEEIEKAARGVDGRRYPWGDGFDLSFVKRSEEAPGPVGTNDADVSPYGIRDLASSLAELFARSDGSPGLIGGTVFDADPRDFELHASRLDAAPDALIERVAIRLVRTPRR